MSDRKVAVLRARRTVDYRLELTAREFRLHAHPESSRWTQEAIDHFEAKVTAEDVQAWIDGHDTDDAWESLCWWLCDDMHESYADGPDRITAEKPFEYGVVLDSGPAPE